jgi:hypothetical protein
VSQLALTGVVLLRSLSYSWILLPTPRHVFLLVGQVLSSLRWRRVVDGTEARASGHRRRIAVPLVVDRSHGRCCVVPRNLTLLTPVQVDGRDTNVSVRCTPF